MRELPGPGLWPPRPEGPYCRRCIWASSLHHMHKTHVPLHVFPWRPPLMLSSCSRVPTNVSRCSGGFRLHIFLLHHFPQLMLLLRPPVWRAGSSSGRTPYLHPALY